MMAGWDGSQNRTTVSPRDEGHDHVDPRIHDVEQIVIKRRVVSPSKDSALDGILKITWHIEAEVGAEREQAVQKLRTNERERVSEKTRGAWYGAIGYPPESPSRRP